MLDSVHEQIDHALGRLLNRLVHARKSDGCCNWGVVKTHDVFRKLGVSRAKRHKSADSKRIGGAHDAIRAGCEEVHGSFVPEVDSIAAVLLESFAKTGFTQCSGPPLAAVISGTRTHGPAEEGNTATSARQEEIGRLACASEAVDINPIVRARSCRVHAAPRPPKRYEGNAVVREPVCSLVTMVCRGEEKAIDIVLAPEFIDLSDFRVVIWTREHNEPIPVFMRSFRERMDETIKHTPVDAIRRGSHAIAKETRAIGAKKPCRFIRAVPLCLDLSFDALSSRTRHFRDSAVHNIGHGLDAHASSLGDG